MEKNAYEKWTIEDDNNLVVYIREGKAENEIATMLGRSAGAIRSRMSRLLSKLYDDEIQTLKPISKIPRRLVKQEELLEQFRPTEIIKIGSKVRLKSGGPIMTVDYVSKKKYRCIWFTSQTMEEYWFSKEVIEKHDTSKPKPTYISYL